MAEADIEAVKARLQARANDLDGHYGEAVLGRWVDEVKVADLRALLADHAKQAERINEARGVLEWIANHRNDGLTDGSAATRTCLDEIVNLAASALSSLPAEPRGDGVLGGRGLDGGRNCRRRASGYRPLGNRGTPEASDCTG